MSEGDAQVMASPSIPRLAELGRAITRGIKSVAETTSGPSFAASLASANQTVQGDESTDGTVAHGGHRAGEAPLGGAEFGPRARRDHAAGASPTGAFEPATSAPTQPYVAAASASASQPVSPAYSASSPAAASPTYATHGPPGPSTLVPAVQTATPATASPTYRSAPPTTVAPYGSAPATNQAPQASPAASTVASVSPRTSSSAPNGLTADARTAATDAAPTYAATATPAPTAGTANAAMSATGATTATTTAVETGTSQPLALSQYPLPSRTDRSGVLNWASNAPPTGRDVDRLTAEARHRKAGWVTFTVNPDEPDEYGKLADRLTRAGIQPIARIEDPYGDLPAEDVSAIVKELRDHGVRYFQLFDGANVASETPDDRVDVKEYAERWLTAAKAVVAGGGLPGVGALAPDGDYDDLGFLRHLLSAVKERGGADVLGQSWVALRGEKAGATATQNDAADLADRASWFDRVSRQALGRSLPILATQDPAGQPERLTADPATATSPSQVDQSEQALRRHRRSLPALFAASRGTLGPART